MTKTLSTIAAALLASAAATAAPAVTFTTVVPGAPTGDQCSRYQDPTAEANCKATYTAFISGGINQCDAATTSQAAQRCRTILRQQTLK